MSMFTGWIRACSDLNELVQLTASEFLVPQVSFESHSTDLSDTTLYPMFSRMSASQDFLTLSLLKLIEKYRWQRFNIIASDDSDGSNAVEELKRAVTQMPEDFQDYIQVCGFRCVFEADGSHSALPYADVASSLRRGRIVREIDAGSGSQIGQSHQHSLRRPHAGGGLFVRGVQGENDGQRLAVHRHGLEQHADVLGIGRRVPRRGEKRDERDGGDQSVHRKRASSGHLV